jgi:hypothetical protein
MNIVFAAEAEEALAKTTPRQRSLVCEKGEKLYLGHEQRAGWNGELPFYLFLCEVCARPAKDYPHGFTGNQYLSCSHCGERHDFIPR